MIRNSYFWKSLKQIKGPVSPVSSVSPSASSSFWSFFFFKAKRGLKDGNCLPRWQRTRKDSRARLITLPDKRICFQAFQWLYTRYVKLTQLWRLFQIVEWKIFGGGINCKSICNACGCCRRYVLVQPGKCDVTHWQEVGGVATVSQENCQTLIANYTFYTDKLIIKH